ncbi:hypothetical protein LINGRAHAP2_LOCUS18721 [Linum grandiflorum]
MKGEMAMKLDVITRCAKAALLVSSLRSTSAELEKHSSSREEEAVSARKEIQYLKMKLAREKHRSSRIKLCGSIELAIRVSILLLLLSTFVILLAPIPLGNMQRRTFT